MAGFSVEFLGTCACDFSPKLTGEFKDKFDLDARRASSVLVNGNILIDCGPHCCNSLDIIKKDYSEITDIFITHLHSDHFDIDNIKRIAKSKQEPLRLWIREDAAVPRMRNVRTHRMIRQAEYAVCGGITAVSLSANHDPRAFPQWILLKNGKKKMLYALDGAWFTTGTYNYLKKSHLDLIVADATVGDYEGDYRMAEHNSIPMIRLMLPSLKKTEIIGEKTKIILSHIAPSLHKPHSETEKIAAEFSATAAHDGMKIRI